MKINTYAVNCNDAWLNTEGDDISGSYVKYKDHLDVVDELEAKCAALAAENAALKAACERVAMWNDFPQATIRSTGEVVPYVVAYGSNGERDYMRNIAATAVLKYTPDTDAFLAEVRAQGVEMYAEHLTRKAIASGENKNHAYAYLAANFAAQLRQEAAQ